MKTKEFFILALTVWTGPIPAGAGALGTISGPEGTLVGGFIGGEIGGSLGSYFGGYLGVYLIERVL